MLELDRAILKRMRRQSPTHSLKLTKLTPRYRHP
jgi:hypothetical protein